jgi:hypothetical protein
MAGAAAYTSISDTVAPDGRTRELAGERIAHQALYRLVDSFLLCVVLHRRVAVVFHIAMCLSHILIFVILDSLAIISHASPPKEKTAGPTYLSLPPL